MSRYLVTGCAGFIGSQLTEALLGRRHEVVGVDSFTDAYPRERKEDNLAAAREHDAFALVEADVASAPLEPLLDDIDGVFHLAGQPGVRSSWGQSFDTYLQRNVHATQRLVEAASTAGVRVVFASSSSVYGEADSYPTAEDAVPRPASPYGVSKLACEHLVRAYETNRDLDAVTLRYFTVYGPRQRPDMAVARMLAALDGDAPFTLLGGGRQSRQLTYVGDVVEATLAAMSDAPSGAVYNVAGDTEACVLDLIAAIEEIAGRAVPVARLPRADGDVTRTAADSRRIRDELGWRPRVSLAEGLSAQVECAVTRRPATAPVATPLVSIVVPVLDGEDHLGECLDSLLAQTHPRIEVLVMDDASSDGTAGIIASYGDRVRHHRQERTLGIYENANRGIALAGGELVAVYHADDVYHAEIVERQAAYLAANPEVGAVFCKDIFVDADGRPFGKLELLPEVAGGAPLGYATVLDTLLRHKNNFLRCPSSMVRASVYAELGGYRQDRFRNTSDIEMWLRIARRHRLGVLDEHLFWYRRGHGSSSERYHSLRTDPERFFEIMDLELEAGGRATASPAALAAYEGHRAADWLGVAISRYVLGESDSSRAALSRVRARDIVASPSLRRTRLLVLLALMRALAPLPRVPPAAAALDRRTRRAGIRAPRAARRLPAPA